MPIWEHDEYVAGNAKPRVILDAALSDKKLQLHILHILAILKIHVIEYF